MPSYQLSWSFCEYTHIYKHHYTFLRENLLIAHFILLFGDFRFVFQQKRSQFDNVSDSSKNMSITFGLSLCSEIESEILFCNQHDWLVIIVIKSLWSRSQLAWIADLMNNQCLIKEKKDIKPCVWKSISKLQPSADNPQQLFILLLYKCLMPKIKSKVRMQSYLCLSQVLYNT